MKPYVLVLFCLTLAIGACAQDTGKIFVVRHAEKQGDTPDTPLSSQGQARAECLAATLKDVHINSVLTTQYIRTKQTAAPLVTASHATEKSLDAKALSQIVSAARIAAQSGNVLIVGHSNTVPDLMKEFGAPAVTIPDTTYDQLFVLDAKDPKQLMILHYCPTLPEDTTKHAPNSMAH